MRLGCYAILGAIFCFVLGFQGCSNAVKFQKPVTMTAKQFIAKTPQEGWYHITDATILLTEAKYMVSKSKYDHSEDDISKADDIYLPVHAGEDLDGKTTLLLKTHDPAIKATLLEMDVLNNEKNQEKIDAWIDKNTEKILITRDLSGMVASGIMESSSDKEELAKIGEELGPNFVIMQEGEKPSALKSFGLMIAGVALGIVSLFLFGVRPGGKG